jgi:methylenetetrahydrofolate--tRNA-(uracil-5-)-methyltransferase
MNVNFGLFPPIEAPKVDGKRLRGTEKSIARKVAMTTRALDDTKIWLGYK